MKEAPEASVTFDHIHEALGGGVVSRTGCARGSGARGFRDCGCTVGTCSARSNRARFSDSDIDCCWIG